MKGTTLLPNNVNIGTPENLYDKIKILQSREEKRNTHQETRSIVGKK